VVVRIVLSLFLLVSALIFTTNGCGNTSFSDGEEKAVADNVNTTPGNNMTETYKTATFALG